MQNTSKSSPAEILNSNSIAYRASGAWIRIKASWRGGSDFNVAINRESGKFKDHSSGERGNFEKLCSLLNISADFQAALPSSSSKEEEDKKVSHRVEAAKRLWDRAELMQSGDFSYQYLVSRGGVELAEAALSRAKLRTGLSKKDKYEASSDCLIAPIIDTADAEVCGVQRIWGRGHSGKKMLGVHIPQIPGSEARHSGGMQISGTGDTLYITEGLETGLAVATATGAPVFVLFDGSGLERVPSLKGLVNLGIKKIVVAGDHDKEDTKGSFVGQKPGHRYAQSCAQRLLLQGIKDVKVSIPDLLEDQEKTDWLDVFVACGKEEVRRLLIENEISQEIDPERLSTIQSISWFEAAPEGFMPIATGFDTLETAQAKMVGIIEKAMDSDDLTILAATVGTGKTEATARVINNCTRPVLFLARTLEDAWSFAEKVPGSHLHEGRNNKNCLKFESLVGPIQAKSRAPYAWACQTCEHGPREAVEPCSYMIDLRSSSYKRVVVAAHAAGAEDSTLYSYMSGVGSSDEESLKRKLIIDEAVSENTIHRIGPDDIQTWRQTLSSKKSFIDSEDKKAEAWATGMATALDALAIELASSPTDNSLHSLDLETFKKLGTKIPKSVRVADATLPESIKLPSRSGEEMIIPVKGIQALAEAMNRGTAWIQNGKIVAVVPGSLWKKAQTMGALILDATPSLSSKQTAKIVHEIRVRERGQIIQVGPVQHGRGQLADPTRLQRESRDFTRAIGETGVGIGAKPLASFIKKTAQGMSERVGHWGLDEKAHNRWKNTEKLVIWGAEIPNPSDMIILYKSFVVQMKEIGVEVEDWNGETSKNQIIVMEDGSKIAFPGPLPTVEDAKAWLIDRVSGQVGQAIGRLRLCRRTDDSAVVEIHTPFPVMGHGIRIDKRITGSGRAGKKIENIQKVAEVIDIAEHSTAKEIIKGVEGRGHRISERAAREIVKDLKSEAISSGKSLAEVTEATIREAGLMLHYFSINEAIVLAEKECSPATIHLLEAISERERSSVRAHAGP